MESGTELEKVERKSGMNDEKKFHFPPKSGKMERKLEKNGTELEKVERKNSNFHRKLEKMERKNSNS